MEPHFVLLFDEFYNEVLKEKQLDIQIRFWKHGQVMSQYLTTVFMGPVKSEEMFNAIFKKMWYASPYFSKILLSCQWTVLM